MGRLGIVGGFVCLAVVAAGTPGGRMFGAAAAMSVETAVRSTAAPPASISLSEKDLLGLCRKIPPRENWFTSGVAAPSTVSLPKNVTQVQVETPDGVDCAFTLAEFLSLRAEGEVTPNPILGIPMSTPPGSTDDNASDLLLWTTISNYQSNVDLNLATRHRILADLQTGHTSRSPRFARSTIAASMMVDPHFVFAQFKAEQYETIAEALSSIRVIDGPPLLLPQYNIRIPAAQPAAKERARTVVFADFFDKALSQRVGADFFDITLPLGEAEKSNLTALKVDILKRLSYQSAAVIKRVILDWLSRAKPIQVDAGLVGARDWSTPAVFNERQHTSLGRCSGSDDHLTGVTSIDNYESGMLCQYHGGDNGFWNINVMELSTKPYRIAPGVSYTFYMESRLKGGHRKGQFLGASNEDETTTINYTLTGTADIPQCDNVGVCNSIITLRVNDFSSIGQKFGHDPSTTMAVTYQSANINAPVEMPARSPVLVDRAAGPVHLIFKLTRHDRHVGSCCVKDWIMQMVQVDAAAGMPSQYYSDPFVGSRTFLMRPHTKTDMFSDRFTLGQLPADLSRLGTLSVENRFKDIYLRLALVGILEHAPPSVVDAYDRESLLLARKSLSDAALNNYLGAIRLSYANLQAAMNAVDFVTIIKPLTHAIDHLIATRKSSEIDNLDFLDELNAKISGDSKTGVAASVAAAKTAAVDKDKQQVIVDLMELRERLWSVEADWAQELKDYAVELSLYPS